MGRRCGGGILLGLECRLKKFEMKHEGKFYRVAVEVWLCFLSGACRYS